MKIGASTLAGHKEPIANTLGYFEDLGLDYAEILYQFPNDEINPDSLESFDLKYSVHSPIVDINIASLNKAIRKASIDEIKKAIDLANKLDSDIVVVHPGSIPFLGKGSEDGIYALANSAIKELGEYGDDLGVTATIENMPAFEGMMYQDMEKLNQTLEAYDMFMTLDIGHAYHCGYSPSEMYFPRIKHIHAHDNNGNDDSHYSLGEGSINLKEIITKFESKNYDGIYIIEVNNKDSVKKSLEFLKSY